MVDMDDVRHYAAGLKEDTEKGYSKRGKTEEAMALMKKDFETIGIELLEILYEENKIFNKYSVLLGAKIWQVYLQEVQPFLSKVLKM